MANTHKPTIGLMPGDPAGIGPEITLRILALPDIQAQCHPILIAPWDLVQQWVPQWAPALCPVKIESPSAAPQTNRLAVLDIPWDGSAIEMSAISQKSGTLVYNTIRSTI